MLELMARGGMRVGEVLKLYAVDADDQKLTIRNPKSGKSSEAVFIPKKLADRLKDYIRTKEWKATKEFSPFPIPPRGLWSEEPVLWSVST
jgi:integrase/recombinase XerD